MNICTAPIGKHTFNLDPKLILAMEEIDNSKSIVLFNVKLPARISRTHTIQAYTFGICNTQGKIEVFGLATYPVMTRALLKVNRNASGLANKLIATARKAG